MGVCCISTNKQEKESKSKNDQSIRTKNLGPVLKPPNLSGLKELKYNYHFGDDLHVLGEGSYGKVYLSKNIHNSNYEVAIKELGRKRLEHQIKQIKEEMKTLKRLDHANIVKYYESYQDENAIHLVMEYVDGGELFDKIKSSDNQKLSEQNAQVYMKKLFGAVSHMHSQGIIHRDIKPQNIMLNKNDELKLIDFGLSQKQDPDKKMQNVAGTPYYMAPEVIMGDYDNKCDIWSLGCILYVFMSGYLPFQGRNVEVINGKIQDGKYHFKHKEFQDCSPEVIDLIKKLLVVDPKLRLSARDALQHPWFKLFDQKIESDALNVDPQVLKCLKEFKGTSKLKKAALNILVKMIDFKHIEKLRIEFQKIDSDESGLINFAELKEAFTSNGDSDLSDEKIQLIIEQCDYNSNSEINYTEFIAACINIKFMADDVKLRAIFSLFDSDGNGELSRDDLIKAMDRFGNDFYQEDLDHIFYTHDLTKTGSISMVEFKAMLFDITDQSDAEFAQIEASMQTNDN